MTDYKIKLDVFEGPFDLLLHLIKEEELNIYDIPISKITTQYFEYLDVMKQLNMDVAGEFLVMASTLVYIKSRMLLPSPPATEEDDASGQDPREELVRRLLEYKKFKDAAVTLREKETLQTNSFSREFLSDWDENDSDYLKEVSVFQLLALFRKILTDSGQGHLYEVTLEDVSVTEKMNEIMDLMATTPKVLFQDFFNKLTNKMEIIGTFLALLELIKQQLVRAFQQDDSIWVQKADDDPRSEISLVEDLAPAAPGEQTDGQNDETNGGHPSNETGKE
ncbi:MAG: segregation/condensation protein A [Nitrospinae bacterium]|nr:segregation/condensation protein A [Nitrospinota bacterium]